MICQNFERMVLASHKSFNSRGFSSEELEKKMKKKKEKKKWNDDGKRGRLKMWNGGIGSRVVVS